MSNLTDLDDFKRVLDRMKIKYDEFDDGQPVIAVGTLQDSGATLFRFSDEGKFDWMDTPLVRNCLTERM